MSDIKCTVNVSLEDIDLIDRCVVRGYLRGAELAREFADNPTMLTKTGPEALRDFASALADVAANALNDLKRQRPA